MGAHNARLVARIRGSDDVIFALAVIVACVAANGSMPTIAEREVDIIPEDEELIQAKADEMSLVQADSNFFPQIAKIGNRRPGILGKDITTSERSQRDIANGGDPPPTVDREDSYSPEI